MAVGTASINVTREKASVRLFRMGVWVYVGNWRGTGFGKGSWARPEHLRALGSEMESLSDGLVETTETSGSGCMIWPWNSAQTCTQDAKFQGAAARLLQGWCYASSCWWERGDRVHPVSEPEVSFIPFPIRANLQLFVRGLKGDLVNGTRSHIKWGDDTSLTTVYQMPL